MSVDKVRAAEQALIAEARKVKHHSALQDAVRELDAVMSPLPSREELDEWAPHLNRGDMELVGACWFRWLADQPDHIRNSVRELADELETRRRQQSY